MNTRFEPCRYSRAFKTLRNKGGKAFIYKINNIYRVVFKFFSGDIVKKRIKFTELDKAVNFSRRVLLDYYMNNVDDAIYFESDNSSKGSSLTYPVYMRDYQFNKVRGHDDLCLSYWYKLGSARAFVSTYRTKRHSDS